MIERAPAPSPSRLRAHVPGHTPGDTATHTARAHTARLALILVAAFMVVLDFTIVNVALPSIELDLRVSTSSVQWVVTSYGIAYAGLLILGGRAGDLLGRRRMFVAGLAVFALASLAAGLAQDLPMLVAARVSQGVGAAVIAPTSLALITTSVPEGAARTRAIGLYGSVSAVGFVSGQVLGGVLSEWVGWRSVFLVNVPFGLAAVALVPRLIKAARPNETTGNRRSPASSRRPGLDIRGAALITATVALIV